MVSERVLSWLPGGRVLIMSSHSGFSLMPVHHTHVPKGNSLTCARTHTRVNAGARDTRETRMRHTQRHTDGAAGRMKVTMMSRRGADAASVSNNNQHAF